MSRYRIGAGAVAAAALVGVLGAAVAGASGSATPSAMRLFSVDLPKTEIYVDNGKKGESPGDMILFAERLHRGSRSGQVVGRLEVLCTFVSERGSRCNGTMILAGGTLEAAGRVSFGGPRVRIPVVGGTKAYAGARGELAITEVNDSTDRYDITLQS